MINVYRKDGAYKTKNGQSYDIKTINEDQIAEYIKKGWHGFLDEALTAKDPEPVKQKESLSSLGKEKGKQQEKPSLKVSGGKK